MAATCSRTITTAISAMRARICRRSRRWRPIARIYLGTFSKSLGGGLRVGYMVVPDRIAEAVRSEKCLLGNGTPWLEQATLADFIRTGSYSAHLLRLRAHYKENRDCLVDALRRNFGDVRGRGRPQGGLRLVWYPPPGIPDAATVEALRGARGSASIPFRGRRRRFRPRTRRRRWPASSAMPRCRASRSRRGSRGCRTPSTMPSTIPPPT